MLAKRQKLSDASGMSVSWSAVSGMVGLMPICGWRCVGLGGSWLRVEGRNGFKRVSSEELLEPF